MLASNDQLIVVYILVPLFLVVGIYLLIYSRKRQRMVRRFAEERDYSYLPCDGGETERLLNGAFEETGNAVRSFSRVKDIVNDHDITLFRCTELLDVSKYGKSEYPHHGRIAVLFDAPGMPDFWGIIERGDGRRVVHPSGADVQPGALGEPIKKVLETYPLRHTLSVTVKHGKVLIYFMPFVTGAEKLDDVASLVDLSRQLRKSLQ